MLSWYGEVEMCVLVLSVGVDGSVWVGYWCGLVWWVVGSSIW